MYGGYVYLNRNFVVIHNLCEAPIMQRGILNAMYRNYSNVGKPSGKYKRKSGKNGEVMRKYNVENKSLFGDLMETAREKRKNLPNAPLKTVINRTYRSTKNEDHGSELWWWNKTSSVINLIPKDHEQSENNIKIDDKTSTPVMNLEENNFKLRESCNFYTTSLRLPSVIVKNIATFPLENEKKGSVAWSTPVNDVMSLKVEGDIESKNKSVLSYPSVTKILSATVSEASRVALQRWKEKLIAKLGEEGFKIHQEGILESGKKFHNTIHTFLSGTRSDDLFLDPAVEGCWNSLGNVINDVSDVKVLESHVVHSQLLYRGFLDCIALYKGQPLIIEWKRSERQKSQVWNTYDAPLQLAAYLGAVNFDDNYDFKVRKGLIVVAYTDGSPAHVHELGVSELQKHWRAWLKRLHKYWNLVEENSASES